MEKAEWKPFRNAIPKSEKKQFDEMFDIPRLYLSACSNSVQLVPLHPIIISILFHHYKELKKCISVVERIGTKVYTNNKELMIKEQEEARTTIITSTLDAYVISNKTVES
jgi:hypothetical protein